MRYQACNHLISMSEVKLILLDFDGTLVDTRRANALAYIATLEEVGVTISESEYLSRFYGMRCMEFMRELGFEDDEEIERLRRRKIELYPNYFNFVTLNEALWNWCQMMRAMGVKVWIVSTGHIDNITNVMRYLRLESGVDGLITGDDVARPKPYPDAFCMAMESVGVLPKETIIFEDSEIGLEAARRSGASYVKIAL